MIRRLSIPALPALVVVVTLVGVIAAACGGGDSGALTFTGRNLEIRFERPVETKRVFFTANDAQYLLEVADPGTRIWAVKLHAVNRQINIVKLRVDSGSVEIGNGRAEQRFNALSPLEMGTKFTGEMPEDEIFIPLLWGEFELERGFQAGGWIFFEVPAGTDINTLWWSSADDIIGRF
jgi:hypothetical protein